MAKESISADEIASVAQELLQLLRGAIPEQTLALRLRCEIGTGHGTTELYVIDKRDRVRHILYEREILRSVFDRLYELPSRVQSTNRPWSLAVFRWDLDAAADLSLIEAPEPDVTMTAQRRDDWEKNEFPGRIVEHVDTLIQNVIH